MKNNIALIMDSGYFSVHNHQALRIVRTATICRVKRVDITQNVGLAEELDAVSPSEGQQIDRMAVYKVHRGNDIVALWSNKQLGYCLPAVGVHLARIS